MSSSNQPVDLSTYDDSQLQHYFMVCIGNSDMLEMSRVGIEMANRWNQSIGQTVQAQTMTQAQPTPSSVFKLKFEKPEPYDGDPRRLSDFTFAVEQYLDNVGENDAIRRQQFASSLLTKRALTWWRTLCVQNPNLHSTLSFSSFLIELRNNFRDVNHEKRTRAALYNLRMQHKDSVQYYIQRFRTLCIELGSGKPDDATCMFQFINGLLPEIRYQLDLSPPVNLHAAELQAEQVYQAIRLRHGAPRGMPQQSHRPTTMSSRDRTPRGAPMELGSAQTPRGGQPSTSNQQQRRDLTCFRCNRKGHTARYCRAPQPASSFPAANQQRSGGSPSSRGGHNSFSRPGDRSSPSSSNNPRQSKN